ncbi:MAG TPA: DUF2283 domain-containing protein [Tepidiformaceae bacterium]|nr:DUF2283 domain-containing protein [Tepidiformaceae bacterium]
MKLHYYPETDSLYISFVDKPPVDAIEVADGLVADLDEAGKVVGLDIDQASRHLDLATIETIDLPAPTGTPGR